jgi:hypothetical protein
MTHHLSAEKVFRTGIVKFVIASLELNQEGLLIA